MNFDLDTTQWTKVENLETDKTYVLQAKRGEVNFSSARILFTQADAVPTGDNIGLWGDCFKFKKSTKNIYIRTNAYPLNIQIEEI